MAALAAADVSYSVTKSKKLDDNRLINEVTVTFGDGVKTYPVGGVPLTLAKLGCPTFVDFFNVDDNGLSGFYISYDKAGVDLRLFKVTASLFAELSGDAVPAQTLKVTVIGR